ncbi:MAG: CHAP domain-containing protein [Hyphomonadaceae bacterium]|nr:CHAP domain-containing protein [Hyphomonadaceae bacterium]
MARFFLRATSAAAMLAGLAACAPTMYSAAPSPAPRSPHAYPGQGPAILPGDRFLQCVPYARALSGIWLQGDAHTWWGQAEGLYARSSRPEIGAVLVLRGYNDPNRGHLAVVTAILSEREILVDQANWLNQGEISVRVPVVDVSPDGDWRQVRVWHIPSGSLGVRTYEAEGFILPGPSA